MLTTASEIIDAFGGTRHVAKMLDVGASAVSNYRRNGFPAAKYYALAKACEANGLVVDERVFGRQNAPASPPPRHFQYESRGGSTGGGKGEDDSLLNRFIEAGFQTIETSILQPSAPFINRMGAEMQRRLYRFTDPGGEELCLRPDLTLPTALKYVQDGTKGEARYCYQGTAFRYQPRGAGKPEEFTQSGIEIIGGKTGEAEIEDDAEVLTQLLRVITAAGVADFNVNIIGTRITEPSKTVQIPPEKLEKMIPPSANSMIAGRSGARIAQRIEAKKRMNAILEEKDSADYSDIPITRNPAKPTKLSELVCAATGLNAENFSDGSVQVDGFHYYTGLSFEIIVPALGARQVLASGGRYDDLLQSLGAQKPVPAVGGAISVERLYEAASKQAGKASTGGQS